jgi:hypothetical protein
MKRVECPSCDDSDCARILGAETRHKRSRFFEHEAAVYFDCSRCKIEYELVVDVDTMELSVNYLGPATCLFPGEELC